MFTLLLLVITATALYSGAPWLFSLALTGLLVSVFPVVIFLVIIVAVAMWAFNRYR